MLVRPIWMPLQETFQLVAVGAALGVGAALVGFPWVGAGMVLALGALGIVIAAPLTAVSHEVLRASDGSRRGPCAARRHR